MRRLRVRISKGPAPKLADGTPDLSGVWLGGGPIGDIADGLAPGETIPTAARGEEDHGRAAVEGRSAGELPADRRAAHRALSVADRRRRRATHIFFLFEGNIHSYRQIFMDGRKHPADPDPTWYGHSIGRWEGDTLVVDTVGFNDKFWFDYRVIRTPSSCTPSNATRGRTAGTLDDEVTIDDPGAYSRPFTITFTARAAAGRRNHGIHLQREQPGRAAPCEADGPAGRSGARARNTGHANAEVSVTSATLDPLCPSCPLVG